MPTAIHAHCLLLYFAAFIEQLHCIAAHRICCSIDFRDCGESYGSNIAKRRVETRADMSLLAHGDDQPLVQIGRLHAPEPSRQIPPWNPRN
jgi:hypothetical protein